MTGVGPDGGQYQGDECRQAQPTHAAAYWRKQGLVEHEDDQVQTESGPDAPGKQEEGGSGFVCVTPDAVPKETVDARQLKPVIERKQYSGNGGIPEQVSDDHLHVTELLVSDPSGDGKEGHATEAGADHAKGHGPPWTAASAKGEIGHGVPPARAVPDPQQQSEIGDDGSCSQDVHAHAGKLSRHGHNSWNGRPALLLPVRFMDDRRQAAGDVWRLVRRRPQCGKKER